jgi:hypothetical protein
VEVVVLSLLIADYFHVLFVEKLSVAQPVKKFLALYGKKNIRYHVQKRQKLDPIPSLQTPHPQTHLCYHTIKLPSALWSSKSSLFFSFYILTI